MKFPRISSILWTVVGCTALFAMGLGVVSCGTGGGTTSSGTGNLTVSLSDPATCSMSSGGSFQHVYVTIDDVEANTSATASSKSSGWVDLTPGLKNHPQQVDLLGQANNACFLATLGDNLQIQAGNYQQIRVILAPNSSTMLTNNACATASAVNCVVVSDGSGGTKTEALQLSSEAQTGLKIPSGQIAGGKFDLPAGQTRDLDINFNTCESIVKEGNGAYRLLPVLHAGEVSTTSSSINGTVELGSSKLTSGDKVLIALEQPNSSGVDQVVESTLASSDGTFVFCPIPAGTYDVVAVGVNAAGQAYQPAIVTGVKNGETAGTIHLTASTTGSNGMVTLNGLTTTSSGTSASSPGQGIAEGVQLSVLEKVNTSNATGTYTIPLLPLSTQQASTASYTTATTYTDPTTKTSTNCPTNTDCASYGLMVPSGAPYIGAWSSSGASLTLSTSNNYTVNGVAPNCNNGTNETASPSPSTQVLTGSTITFGNKPAFYSCQ